MVIFQKSAQARLHTSMGEFALELLVDKAPRTCENFARLAHQGFYDGLTFHRVLADFMIQAGCPKGDGTGGPGYTIRPEFNDTPHVRGTVSMARNNDPHSAGSQFFVCTNDARYLDYKYSAFARLLDGDEVLAKICEVAVEENRYKECSSPRFPIYINRIEIEGAEFDETDMPESARDGGRSTSRSESKGGDQRESSAEVETEQDVEAPEEQPAPRKKAASSSRSGSSGGKAKSSASTKAPAKKAASAKSAASAAKKPAGKKTTTKKKATTKRAKKD